MAMTKEQRKKQKQTTTGRQVSTPVITPLPNYTGGAKVQQIPNYTGGATLEKLPNTVQQGYNGALTGPNANPQVIGQTDLAPGTLYALTGRAGGGRSQSSVGGSSSSVRAGGSYGGNSERPTYTPKYQGYIDELLGGIKDYGEYQSPYAERIEGALGQIEGYGPYHSPYRQQLDDALAGIQGYGPYQSQYADQIAEQLAAIQGRGPFSYDLESDPAWQAYKQQYTREGRRASEDTLGQYAAMTGGMPSTAAMAAAQQAGNYYAAQMNDKIPELYKLAYDMYLNEGDRMTQNLNTLRGLDSDDYGRWADAYNRMLSGYDALRAADQTAYGRYGDDYNRMLQNLSTLQGMDESQYGRWQDAYNRMLTDMDAYRTMENDAYGKYRDTVGDWENDRAFAYNAEQDAWEQAYKERAYEDSRADTAWEQEYQQRAYDDSRADTAWEQAYKQTAYDDSRADTEWERAYAMGEVGPTIYAYGDGEPYEIGSGKGRSFVESAQPGQTMTGGDGSYWTKNADGSTTITKNGHTWTVAAPAVATSGGGRSGGGGSGGGTKTGSGKWDAVDDWVAMYGDDSAEDYIREHYKELGFSSMSAALSGWKNHLLEIGYEKPKEYEPSVDSVRGNDKLDSHDVMHGIRDNMGLNSVAGTGWGVNTNTGSSSSSSGKSAGLQRVENSIAGMAMGLTTSDIAAYASYAIEDALDSGEITPDEAEYLIKQFGY